MLQRSSSRSRVTEILVDHMHTERDAERQHNEMKDNIIRLGEQTAKAAHDA